MGKTRGGCLSELSRIKGGRKDLKIEELDEESQFMIANIEALRELNDRIYNKVLNIMNKSLLTSSYNNSQANRLI